MKPRLGHAPMPAGVESDGIDWETKQPNQPRQQKQPKMGVTAVRKTWHRARIQEWLIEQDDMTALRARADELGRIIAEDQRRTAERQADHAAILQRVRDLGDSQQTAQKLFGGGILAQIRARRKARKAKKLAQRKGR